MTAPVRLPDGRVPVVLSAHNQELLTADARALLGYLDRNPADIGQIAAHLLATRRIRRHRVVVRAADRGELTDALRALADGRQHPLIARSSRRIGTRTAFVFPGQGGQWPAMGADAYRSLPRYRAEADRIDAALQAHGMPSALPFLTTPLDPEAVSQYELHGGQFIHAVALAAVWRSCGIWPDLTIGHSLGEVAAAYVAEAITLADAVAVLAARARAIAAIPGRNGVAVLGVDPARADELIAATPGWLELSAVNATRSVAVAGERPAIAAIAAMASEQGLFARELAMSFPAHTSVMDEQRDQLLRSLPAGVFADSAVQFIGSATGAVVAAGTEFGPYWYANLRNTIRFDQAARAAIDRGAGTFLEMSAHPALLFAIEDALEHSGNLGNFAAAGDAVSVGSGHRDEPVAECLAAHIAEAAVADPRYRWADLLATGSKPLRGLPGAPMRAEHLWARPEPLPPVAGLTVTAETWRPRPAAHHPDRSDRTVAVIDLGESGTQALCEALAEHRGVALVDPADAETLVVVAPPAPESDDTAGTAAGALDGTAAGALDGTAVVADLARRIDAGLLDYVEAAGARCRDVWLVTTEAEIATADDRLAEPAQAALAAMHRSVGFEHPDQSFHHLDLPPATATESATLHRAAARAILAETGEIALRADSATVYHRMLGGDEGAVPAWPLDCGVLDEVVITGGSGVIGRSYARYLAAHGARRITLLSRRGLDASAVTELRDLGAEIYAPACDITDPDQLRAAAADYSGKGATLVVHAAGTASFAERRELTGAELTAMCAAKIIGLDRFTNTWPLRSDVRMVLCSSVIGVWGGKGTAGYAAANRILDTVAAQQRARGRHCVAVRWGLWEGGGVVDADEMARVERAGLRQMDPVLAVEASLAEHPRDPLILAADPDRLQRFFGTAGGADAAGGAPTGAASTGLVSAGHADDTGATDDSSGAPMTPPEAVRSQLAIVLNADGTTLDLDATLFDLGVDSLLALDLRKRLKRLTGHTVPLAVLLGGITGTDLIATITESEHPA